MLHHGHFNAASRRFHAASTELRDSTRAAEATRRMAYLWAWGVELGRPLDLEDLRESIWSYQIEFQARRTRRLEPEPHNDEGANR